MNSQSRKRNALRTVRMLAGLALIPAPNAMRHWLISPGLTGPLSDQLAKEPLLPLGENEEVTVKLWARDLFIAQKSLFSAVYIGSTAGWMRYAMTALHFSATRPPGHESFLRRGLAISDWILRRRYGLDRRAWHSMGGSEPADAQAGNPSPQLPGRHGSGATMVVTKPGLRS